MRKQRVHPPSARADATKTEPSRRRLNDESPGFRAADEAAPTLGRWLRAWAVQMASTGTTGSHPSKGTSEHGGPTILITEVDLAALGTAPVHVLLARGAPRTQELAQRLERKRRFFSSEGCDYANAGRDVPTLSRTGTAEARPFGATTASSTRSSLFACRPVNRLLSDRTQASDLNPDGSPRRHAVLSRLQGPRRRPRQGRISIAVPSVPACADNFLSGRNATST
jgi:hypothetical protein